MRNFGVYGAAISCLVLMRWSEEDSSSSGPILRVSLSRSDPDTDHVKQALQSAEFLAVRFPEFLFNRHDAKIKNHTSFSFLITAGCEAIIRLHVRDLGLNAVVGGYGRTN